ncbi:MAG TPA: SDR family oxidoreductase [Geminicoccaceae bacterium]|nr:SDR family oxidoreductase [Geminicoccaceae bacterium]
MARLQGKVCIVTGGGSGVGCATCLLFAAEGGRVVVADRNGEAAGRIAAEIGERGGEALALEADVSKAADCRRMVDATVERFGRIDVLVNNAGYGFTGTVVDTSEEDWDALMAVNLKGVFLCSKYAIPVMRRQGGGAIVNIASVVSTVGITDRAAYCASKGGVYALTRAMALDHVDEGIRVNCVAPGTLESPYFDEMLRRAPDPEAMRRGLEERQAMRRLGRPEEIAYAVLYLASDESSFCTGSMLTADGGMTAR